MYTNIEKGSDKKLRFSFLRSSVFKEKRQKTYSCFWLSTARLLVHFKLFYAFILNTVCHTIDFYYLSTLCYWHLLIIKSSLCISFLWYDQIKSSLARVLIRPFICTCHSTVSRKIVPFKNACLSISYPSFIWSRNPLPHTYFPKKMRK